MREILRRNVQALLDIFNDNYINYWIDCGTLLGAIRDGDIIQWDYDADFGVRQQDSQTIYPLIPEILKSCDIKLILCRWHGFIKLLPADSKEKSSWHIDIYPWVEDNGRMFNPQRNVFASRLQGWSKDQIEDFTFIKFLGRNARVPIQYKKRLTKFYGDYMTPVKSSKKQPYWG